MGEMTKALFVPLNTKYYEEFENGTKTKEYRYASRWNERTCYHGRPATLSKGYGKASRLRATVCNFRRVCPKTLSPKIQADILSVFGRLDGDIAEIEFTNIRPIK